MTVPTVNAVSRRHLRQRKTPGRFAKAERLSRRLTMGANRTRRSSEPSPGSRHRPHRQGKVAGTLAAIWATDEIAAPVNVHEHGRTLPLVAVGDNRIGKVSFMRPGTGARERAEPTLRPASVLDAESHRPPG